MFRSLMMALALSLVAPAFVPQAEAASEKKLEQMKSDLDFQKDRLKAVEKALDKVTKDLEKGNNADANALHRDELIDVYRDELASLRDRGIETKETDLPEHPQHEETHDQTNLTDEERAKLLVLRELMVELKNTKPADKPKPYQNKLGEFVKILEDRVQRKEKKYDKEK